ncbi:MAG: carbon-nitrogen hydrolase family protein [Asticcacaulis sp.]|nr:carbon-nitrogen hydrolase family protein [Asticcacaulis sp.]
MRSFAVAALQLSLNKGDNTAVIEKEVRLVKTRFPWIDMVVLGELAMFGANTAQAETLPGPTEDRMVNLARELDIWLVPGSIYEKSGALVYNTASVINPKGEVVARYRKIFPFLPYETGVEAGSEFVVFDVPEVGRFGISICYDMWFAETTRSLVWMGAEVILHPTMTNTIDREAELAIARASAITNQCYFIDINVAGELGVGLSCAYGPGGELIHQAGTGREIMAFELDMEHVRRVRERGWHGLGQPLKSFRDSDIRFPPYEGNRSIPEALMALGPLEKPQGRKTAKRPKTDEPSNKN